ncbi:hypothetical protein L3X39_11660 [Sabulilitoribacter multivorans]|uniref:NIPSNAP protein n=1 Tax=Flaviramulus multivorans TaxID=1304750 RepID=A0ABS9IL31_9FLAO|nr:hypothetical protein [Flaviramulus multivorans]MCF7561293.1 hypothetical protein [Flaviramulus multivorans]
MKKCVFILLVFTSLISFGQTEKVSMIDYVEVLNGNKEEALFYYQNNWEQLRKKAIAKGYIDSHQLLETVPTAETPFTFILITTYKNKRQYDNSETHFQELIEERGELKLLNSKKPPEFRKVILHNDSVLHWN